MNPAQFISKWRQVQLSERAAAQQHFLDLCALVGQPPPAEVDPTGEKFTFERGAAKHGGGDGWADVWKRGCFGWEYKGKHKNLDSAYEQLLQYRESLENPPLLVVCDMERIIVHTNFTAVVNQRHEIPLEELGDSRSLEILRAVFVEPEKLKPGRTSEAVTQKAAEVFATIAASLRARGVAADVSAHFLDRVVFCLFAEDIGLLPGDLFSSLVRSAVADPADFPGMAGQLFRSMAQGGRFGVARIRHFNGSLFEDATALELTAAELKQILSVIDLDWSAVDVTIFGTLFERGMDPAKRAQLGAHYTSRQDIELLVDPVIMQPLRTEWSALRQTIESLLTTGKKPGEPTSTRTPAGTPLKPAVLRKAKGESDILVHEFLVRLQSVKVLDPACGSGNFLYVTLQKLKDLEKEVILFAIDNGLGAFLPAVGPWQLYGIEINAYAYDLALMTVWIGYLQWVKANGFGFPSDPVLHKLEGNFRCMDAILDLTDPANPKQPEWPVVDFIVSNPPFLGTKKLRSELGDSYVEALFRFYGDRLPNFSDLCCYWFEKARQHIADGKCRRAGLLATQGIRGGLNREVLKRIKKTGDIFWAISDREWILDGANVHVSMVGFGDGTNPERELDGRVVPAINPNLTSAADTTSAHRLRQNAGIGFIADVKAGKFDVCDRTVLSFLAQPNPHGAPNSDVVVPWINSLDILRRDRRFWIIDFGVAMPRENAVLFQEPYRIAQERVLPERAQVKRRRYREYWWLHAEPCAEMRKGIAPLSRFLVTPTVAKHRIFAWSAAPTLPDHQLVAFARADDYFFGVLHSRLHEVWALRLGTRLETRPRYTPTTCFETFPFPWAPGTEPKDDPRVQAIAAAAKELCALRDRWLNPPEWTKEEVLEFPATVGGIWDRFIVNPYAEATAEALTLADAPAPDTTIWEFAATERNVEAARQRAKAGKPLTPGQIGTARYPRRVPRDADSAAKLAKRTLTNLYNQRPEWLSLAHRKLDEAVCTAYDWPADLSDDAILERLLALNLERAGG